MFAFRKLGTAQTVSRYLTPIQSRIQRLIDSASSLPQFSSATKHSKKENTEETKNRFY